MMLENQESLTDQDLTKINWSVSTDTVTDLGQSAAYLDKQMLMLAAGHGNARKNSPQGKYAGPSQHHHFASDVRAFTVSILRSLCVGQIPIPMVGMHDAFYKLKWVSGSDEVLLNISAPYKCTLETFRDNERKTEAVGDDFAKLNAELLLLFRSPPGRGCGDVAVANVHNELPDVDAVNQVLNGLYAYGTASAPTLGIVDLFDQLGERLANYKYADLDAIFQNADEEKLAPELIMGMIRFCANARANLQGWTPLRERARRALENRGFDIEELFAGLD